MESQITIVLLILLFIIVIGFKKGSSWKIKKKRRNIQKGKDIILKLNTFDNDGSIISYLRKIDPYVFEELLLTCLESQGYTIKRNKRYSNDGGIDGKAYKDDITYLIQAKRYKGYVSAEHLNKFLNLVNEAKCRGLFIHTGKTGQATYHKYREEYIEIVSGDKLIELLRTIKVEEKISQR